MNHTEVLCLSSEAMIHHHRFLLTPGPRSVVEISLAIEPPRITVVFLFDNLNHLIFFAGHVTYIFPFVLLLLNFMASMFVSFVAFLSCCRATGNFFNLALLLEHRFLITFVQLIKRHESYLTLLELTGIYALLAGVSRGEHVTLLLEGHSQLVSGQVIRHKIGRLPVVLRLANVLTLHSSLLSIF